jgi:hypothetical protein
MYNRGNYNNNHRQRGFVVDRGGQGHGQKKEGDEYQTYLSHLGSNVRPSCLTVFSKPNTPGRNQNERMVQELPPYRIKCLRAVLPSDKLCANPCTLVLEK